MTAGRSIPGEGLLHPVALGCLLVLVVNDHVLKGAYPGTLTGKLSDLSGLAMFPWLLQSVIEQAAQTSGRSIERGRRTMVILAGITAAGFALVKLWAPAAETYRLALACARWPVRLVHAAVVDAPYPPVRRSALTMDPTDLLCLPMVLVPVLLTPGQTLRSISQPERVTE